MRVAEWYGMQCAESSSVDSSWRVRHYLHARALSYCCVGGCVCVRRPMLMATYAIGLNVVPRETLDVRIGDAVYMQIHVCMYLNVEYTANTNSLTNWVLNLILVSMPTSGEREGDDTLRMRYRDPQSHCSSVSQAQKIV